MNKKLLIAIVVIAVAIIAGALIAMTYSKGGESATGQAVNVPGANNEAAPAPANEQSKTVDSTKLEAITEGLSKSKVTDLLGEPTEKQTVTTPKGNVIEYWYYTDSSNQVWQVGFSDDAVSVIRKY